MQPYLVNEQKREMHIEVPLFGADKKPIREPITGQNKIETRIVNEDGFLEILYEVSANLPHLTLWEVVQAYWKDVCITAFVDEVMMRIIAGEKLINDYQGALGSLEKLETREGIFGFDMGYEGTLEAMEITRGGKRSYERWDSEEQERKAKSKQQQGGGGRQPAVVMGV